MVRRPGELNMPAQRLARAAECFPCRSRTIQSAAMRFDDGAHGAERATSWKNDADGFTLLELMMVAFVISILAGIALPQYKNAIVVSKEAVLRENLFRFRDLIDQYQADKGKYPGTLEALVEEGYLRKLPADPMTGAADWEVVLEELDPDNPTETPGIYEVKSASTALSLSGTPYNEW